MHRSLILLPLLACVDKSIGLGGGSADDARMYADVYTWECQDPDTGGNGEQYEGVFSYNVSLEYAPDALVDRELPASGCTKGLDLIPSDAGASAHDIDGSPDWSNGELNGNLDHVGTGFYYDDALGNQQSCQPAEELLGEGTALAGADMFTGATTPAPETFEDVTFSADIDENSGLPFGTEVEISWVAGDWTESFVQIRRESGGALIESVTCNTTGSTTYTVGSDAWDLFSGAVEAEITNLYVGVQKTKTADVEDGQRIQTVTRALHVAVVQD